MRKPAHDQAQGLRKLFEKRGLATLSVGGAAGTTAVTVELAAALAHLDRRVLILDRTRGEAAQRFGCRARHDFAQVLSGEKRLADVLVGTGSGVTILPAARALDAVDEGDALAARALADLLDAGRASFDVCLVNGLAPARCGHDDAARDVLLVTAPTTESVKEAYAQIKALAREPAGHRVRVVVDHARSEAAARSIYDSLEATARRFLAARLDYCGYLPGAAPAPSHGRRGAASAATAAAGVNPRARAIARLAATLADDAAPCWAA